MPDGTNSSSLAPSAPRCGLLGIWSFLICTASGTQPGFAEEHRSTNSISISVWTSSSVSCSSTCRGMHISRRLKIGLRWSMFRSERANLKCDITAMCESARSEPSEERPVLLLHGIKDDARKMDRIARHLSSIGRTSHSLTYRPSWGQLGLDEIA